MTAAGGAAPRAVRRHGGTGRASASGCCYGEWSCVGRVDDLGLDAARQRVAVVDVVGRVACWSPATRDGALHAAYNVCRHRGSQLVPGRPGAEPRRCRARRRRCAAPTTRGPTPSTAGCCARRTPRTSTTSTRRTFSLHPVGGRDLGRLRLRAPDARRRDRRSPTRSARCRDRWPATPLELAGRRAHADLRRRGQLQGRRGELQRVLPLRPGAPRADAGWCRRSAGGGTDLDWDDGHPAPRGRLDVHDDRHHRPGRRSRGSTRPSGSGTRASWSTRT